MTFPRGLNRVVYRATARVTARVVAGLVLLAAPLAAAGSASAAPAPESVGAPHLLVSIAPGDPSHNSPNYVNLVITVSDAATRRPTHDTYDVYAYATGTGASGGSDRTQSYNCGSRSATEVGVPAGIFDCTVIVNHGGKWTFVAVVAKGAARGSPVQLANTSRTFTIDAPTLGGYDAQREQIQPGAGDVVLLQSHVILAAVWVLCAITLAVLSTPFLRRVLSAEALHVLENRRTLLLGTLWVTCGLVVGTGSLLLAGLTPYKVPLSGAEIDVAFRLPYGQAYFLSLGAKLLAFVAMVLATVVLERRSGRWTRVKLDRYRDEPRPGYARAGTGTATKTTTATATKTATKTATAKSAATDDSADTTTDIATVVATVVLGGGLAVIGLCVTLLKYFHEFIEAAKTLGS